MTIENQLKPVLKPINECCFTGLEKRVASPNNWYDVLIFESQVHDCKMVRLVYKIGNEYVSGLLIKKYKYESWFTIDTRYTKEHYRRKGLSKSLLAVAKMKYKNVRHSVFQTELGSLSS